MLLSAECCATVVLQRYASLPRTCHTRQNETSLQVLRFVKRSEYHASLYTTDRQASYNLSPMLFTYIIRVTWYQGDGAIVS